ncbi:hypothetical protein OS11_10580 [Dickeya oryzae]
MNQTLLSEFGTSVERVERALDALRQGRGVMVLDDEDRENEGDMIFPAETMTVEQMALTIRHGSGIVCLCITEERRQKAGTADDGGKQFQSLSDRVHRDHRSG